MGTVVGKEQCDNCVSNGGDSAGDNRIMYDDGSYYCFACEDTKASTSSSVAKELKPLIQGVVTELKERGLDFKTCEKYGVKMSDSKVIFGIFEGAREVKQKVRLLNDKKIQYALGQTSCNRLFGQQLFNPSKSIPIVITEGEFDAMSVYQATGYPAVSITRGSNGALKELQQNMEWLSGWKFVTLNFDNDEAGQKATQECLELFEPGMARVAKYPLKDANDMLVAGRIDEIKKCLFSASIIKPNTLVSPLEILEKILDKPKMGSDWPWATMTKATYGCRWGELYLLAGATSVGKTEICSAIIRQMLTNNVKVGCFSLEQSPADTIRRFIGGTINQRLHIPGAKEWDEELIKDQVEYLNDKIDLYDRGSGMITLEQILINIRYLYKCKGTKFFIIDNLRAMSMRPMIDGKQVPDFIYMTYVMDCLSSICKELEVTIFVLAHVGNHSINVSAKVTSSDSQDWDAAKAVNKEGTSWESGRMTSLETIYGGTRITNLCDYVIGIARNRLSEDDVTHRTIRVRFLKTRLDSYFEGKEMRLIYDYSTGQLTEPEDLLS